MKERNGPRPIGRPPKFAEPRRVVTLTLPESTLRDLEIIDPDRARAIVQATELALAAETGGRAVDLLAVAPDSSVVILPFCRALTEIEGLALVRILPGRYLVLLEPKVTLSEVEVAVLDRIEVLDPEAEDRPILEALLDRLRTLRRARRIRTRQVLLISS